ncbi:CEI_1a_G0052130.mRNA.1.CDS.1 [Saccharomyces cerevisiae]|nr:EM14S01-3B_G0030370.mRNA.1.CDS.1 [Saccharomyces cerevisiae]CAI4808846.1 CEI_1a_G0052130.mRNA.1.CDS.1 [Saccharomyces cerevisiae]CAI4815600.1 AMH_1a_G0052230.mRNA.1.CDS.1 [Saccharomyces cerevisiae]CAI6893607.1 AMH_1a_G0052230.mRNA.1.CDS.1 [Saccharomyces cerevisiae]CAI7470848.1 CEI_1a_G0052130.mRNA.1.CDS.1 [Saccharomyces cerevisiae]
MRGFSGQPLSNDDNYRIEKTQRNTIPERLHFSRERNMPIASIFGTRGYFVFSSEQSYDKFKQTNFNISTLDADGVGVPLFHIVQSYNVIGKITRSSPDFYIYKYVLQGVQDPPLYSECKVICQDKVFRLCKILCCEIYAHQGFFETKYDFFYPSKTQPVKKYQIIKQSNMRDLYSTLDGMRFRWHVKFYSDHYRLMFLDEDRLNYSNSNQKERQKPDQVKSKAPDFVIGHYTRTFSDILPRSTSKCSNLIIGEHSRPDSLGITTVPDLTQEFACQGALIHYLLHIEREKNKKRNRNRNRKW